MPIRGSKSSVTMHYRLALATERGDGRGICAEARVACSSLMVPRVIDSGIAILYVMPRMQPVELNARAAQNKTQKN